MKLDEFAFLNQQLAGMLRAGIPLEGGLRQLSSQMRRGKLRGELEALQRDLAAGIPLNEAVAARKLPELYVRMTQAGAAGGDLSGVLTMLADYYDRVAGILTRLKGLMVYPLIVLFAALGVSILITVIFHNLVVTIFDDPDIGVLLSRPSLIPGMVLPTAILSLLLGAWFLVVLIPRFRNWARWRLPGFREASIAQFAGAASLLLRGGTPLQGSLALLQKTEDRSPAGREVSRWMSLHEQGQAKWSSFTAGSRVFPPLFIWIVAQGGEDLAQGFQRASDIYQARSIHKIDMILYAALPVSIMLLAGLVVGQIFPLIQALGQMLKFL
jgi:type II secretory pathway component PulF